MAENNQVPEVETLVAIDGGNVKIADDVVATIASMAAADIKGVASLRSGFAGDIAGKLTKKQPTKGVKVEIKDNDATIDAFINVEYGSIIPDVCKAIQDKVKAAVETMTGLNVVAINVSVQGVQFLNASAEDAEEK